MRSEDREGLRTLLLEQRQAALGTLAGGAPFVSMVLYAIEGGVGPGLLLHTSRLAAHTGQLLADPRASLLVARPDTGEGDPQALPRVTLQCLAQAIPRDHADYERCKSDYCTRLPTSAYLFDFPDFQLFRLAPIEARYVGGFGRAFTLTAEDLAAVLR